MKKISFLLPALFFLGMSAINAQSQYTILHTFNGIAGAYPANTLVLSGKTLYGTTYGGGKNDSGCVFSIDTNGNNFKDVYDFGGAGNGAFPFGGSLKLAGDRLYGMASMGGANDSGCVFSIDTNGTGYKDLLDFTGSNGADSNGSCSVTLAGAKLFGMTYAGGSAHMGVVFTVDTLGHNYKNLYSFTGGAAGGNPYGDVTVIKDKLFGMTIAGANGNGNIFSLDSNGTNYSDIFDFDGTDGDLPNNILTNVGNKFYGMTYDGGAFTDGNIFSVDTNGGNFNDLLDFEGPGSPPNGQNPLGDVLFLNGYLYGTTSTGGTNDSGNIFKIDTSGAYYTDLYDFSGIADGEAPASNLINVGKTFYGTAFTGGSTEYGVVFKLKDRATTGVPAIKKQVSVKLYPNPSNGTFNVQIKNYGSGITNTLEVYNILGEQVYSASLTIDNSQFTIDLSSRPNGIYLYRVIAQDGSIAGEGKLIIQK